MSTEHDLLTITEVAELTRTPVATLRYWRHLGKGPYSFRLGRHIRYHRHEVHEWIREQRDAERLQPSS